MSFLMNGSDYIYLHGFASSPHSAKARYLLERFSRLQIPLRIPDLNQGNFSELTLTRQFKQVAAQFSHSQIPVTIIGSSFGGLTAAWLGEKYQQVQFLVLLAPAFHFVDLFLERLSKSEINRWRREGYLSVYHYGEQGELPISYKLIEDGYQYQENNLNRAVPTLILHGKYDDVVPIRLSREYSGSRPWVKLVELESDHGLVDVLPQIWTEIASFLGLMNIDK